jgi:mediator of replication checkpoint protein 1
VSVPAPAPAGVCAHTYGREHLEEDDRAVEKVVNDAVQGRLRTKKRNNGLGFEEESDSDDDEDRARRIRSKKRKIEGDSLDALRASSTAGLFWTSG